MLGVFLAIATAIRSAVDYPVDFRSDEALRGEELKTTDRAQFSDAHVIKFSNDCELIEFGVDGIKEDSRTTIVPAHDQYFWLDYL